MSRRKQSNPKPIKRPEDEEEDGEMAQKMDQSNGDNEIDNAQSEKLPINESENEPMELKDIKTEIEISSPDIKEEVIHDKSDDVDITKNGDENLSPKSAEMSPRRQEVMNKLSFPSDLLTLRKVEEAEFHQTGIPWSVSSSVPLSKGSTIGPYQGELVALSSIKPGELVLQFQGGDGEFSFIKVTEESGAWLSLLKPAEQSSTHNTCVYFEGGRIWCEVVNDLVQGTELVASFTTRPGRQSASPQEDKLGAGDSDTSGRDVQNFTTGVKKQEHKAVPQLSPQHALIYGCPFCCVRFSSPRTLEAHLTYYCSKKPSDFVSLQQLQQRLQQQAQSKLDSHTDNQTHKESGTPSPRIKMEQTSPIATKRPAADDKDSEMSENPDDNDMPKNKSSKSGEVYKCLSCNYVSDKLFSLQRHQRLHIADSENMASDPERLSVSPLCQEEMFCKHCNIQFSSMSTYRGHKEFYCQYHLNQQKSEENISESASPAMHDMPKELTANLLQHSPTVVLGRNGQLVANKSSLHPSMITANLLHSPLLLQAISKDISHYFMKNQQSGEMVKLSNDVAAETTAVSVKTEDFIKSAEDQPLDLSKSKPNKNSEMSEEKNNLELDRQVSVKSEPSSPSELSPAAKRAKHGDEIEKMNLESHSSPSKTQLNIPTIHPTLIAGSQVQYVNKKPVPPLQMVSRCVECNIVFYKHENYLIHKEHYCSGRRASKESSSESDNSEAGGTKDNEQVPTQAAIGMDTKTRNETESLKNLRDKHLSGENDSKIPEDQTLSRGSENCYKYFCIPCKIKFSSAGNLKAHKDFYCPHGKENDTSGMVKESGGKDNEQRSPSSDNSNYRCDSCKNEFISSRLLKLHICMGEATPAPLLRCLYCDYVTQTENRLSEHMKVHVPTKAFKCNICGYRGNTARGMRMHGKMHMENGEDFTDDNIIEYQEPPLVPIQRNGVCEKGPVDVETELIRMKNEPYKRRRSRKSFEKSENMVPFISQNILTQICAACGQTFGNVSDFVIHLRMHEIAALEAMKSLKSLRCEHCNDYMADSLTSLLGHMQSKHPEQLPGTSTPQNEAVSGSEGERSQSRDSLESNDRSRSNSVESSRTFNSTSSQDMKAERKTRSPVLNTNKSVNNQCSSDNFQTQVKQEQKDSNVYEMLKKSSAENVEHISNGTRSKTPNDLKHDSKSQEHIKSSHLIDKAELCRSQRSPNQHSSPVSSQRSSPEQESLALDLSPRQLQSPSHPVGSRSPIATQQKLPLPTGEPPISPKVTRLINEDLMSPKRLSPDPKTRYLLSQNVLNIKQEQMSPPLDRTRKKSSPSSRSHTPSDSPKHMVPLGAHSPTLQNLPLLYNPQAVLSLYQFPPGISAAFIATPGNQTSPTSSIPGDKNGRKYCKHCDINFTYLSSFLTHKKYYCSARNSTDDTEGATATA